MEVRPDWPLIEAVLQRHVLEEFFCYVSMTLILLKHKMYVGQMIWFYLWENSKKHDSITPAVTAKIGYSSLENRGFSNITNITNITIEKETYEHNFIHKFKTKLNEEMGQYRKILDTKRKREIEEKAANIWCNQKFFFF